MLKYGTGYWAMSGNVEFRATGCTTEILPILLLIGEFIQFNLNDHFSNLEFLNTVSKFSPNKSLKKFLQKFLISDFYKLKSFEFLFK